jgi:hypothetical protein
MKKQIGVVTLTALLCCGIQTQAADESTPSAAQVARDKAQQLLKERDEARTKAQAAEKKMREAGAAARVESLGFASAKRLRDQEAASGTKATAYVRYAKAARQIEERIKDEIDRGLQPPIVADISRFERLQAEVDLARIEGRLPAKEK